VDLRERHEIEVTDLPIYNKHKVRIPKVQITLSDLLMGMYPEKLPKDKWLVLLCNQGLLSGRAADFLKRNGYHIKILLGGIETLDNVMELEEFAGLK
jgi:rhodanese-related sulfurtransferase